MLSKFNAMSNSFYVHIVILYIVTIIIVIIAAEHEHPLKVVLLLPPCMFLFHFQRVILDIKITFFNVFVELTSVLRFI